MLLILFVAEGGTKSCACLDQDAVALMCQGIGAGRRLMAALETELVRVGAGGVHLGTSPRNVRSQGFYEHLGYRRLAPGELGTPDGAVLYVKAL